LGAEREPESERKQYAGGDEGEGVAAGERFDADDRARDHAGEGSVDQEPREAQLVLAGAVGSILQDVAKR
jgi:hypothetical protein